MRRIQYHQYGGPEVMRLEEFEPARPRSGQVLVRVRAAAANPMDRGLRAGAMKMVTGRTFPRGLGHDFAGVVEAVGPGVTRLRIGDEVLGGASIKASGAFGDVVVADEKAVVHKPANLSFGEAAALPTVGLTAFQALTKKGELQPGQHVFINGCLGGVGRAAAQIALARGALVAGSCRATAVQDARDLGIDPIVGFGFDPGALSGRFDIVLDTAHTLSGKEARQMLKPGGRVVGLHPTPAAFVRAALPGPFRVLVAQAVPEDLDEVAHAAGEGALRVPIARTVPLGQAIEALTELERDGTPRGGKLIITTG
ncbi:NADP-dependent oxidoreductase [Streptomyces sp. CRN 30]|uniref:NADP-dependent oxidoreductase n=1 Tax=Streptomyces sp. CRN 30 TaxID=3075613 RepID=UPI002A813517|nr:NADP-dependent oxidoreductase [Streptomyces sp. CRN 30]